MKKIQKILVANRGEIAVRVLKACREMGIATVAVYSDVDRCSLHVFHADQAAFIGEAPPEKSYLNMDKIIQTARDFKCDAIHPGYGFLAENALFARKCRESGLIFIGPPPDALELVGDKLRARQTMRAAGIPVIPGMEKSHSVKEDLVKFAHKIGFPVMVKASAGGGGKGMRVVETAQELEGAIDAGQREAKSAFGDDTVYLERFIRNPRHVEFQVLADQMGNIVHLFERECSIQRRHQKIIEESPSVALNPKLRKEMGKIACQVMKTVGYQNAGTVEFLLDENGSYYFLEVNARIQVEHPVTEMVTGVDLVKQQIRIAEGNPLPFGQKELIQRGHAIECRIYAEDPENNFFPSVGRIELVQEPAGPGVRCDTGIFSGLEVTPYYDPILSKLIVWDENREWAIEKMRRALDDCVIFGIKTPVEFLKNVLDHPDFRKGNISTHFIERHFSNWKPASSKSGEQVAALAAALVQAQGKENRTERRESGVPSHSPWQTLGKWELFSGSKES